MIKISTLLGICVLATASDIHSARSSPPPIIQSVSDTVVDPSEESALSTGRFFFPTNPLLFTAWRRKTLSSRGLFHDSDPVRFSTFSIHSKISSIVFPGVCLQRIIDTFRSSNDTSKPSPAARAVIRAIYTIRIYRDTVGPLPKYDRHPIYDYIPNYEFSIQRLDVSRVLTFMFLIPRVPEVWNSWKYLADHYRLSSVTELARIVGSIAVDTRMFWFEEMFSH